MLAAISHDLRTPLTRLRLCAERLIDTDARRSMLNDIVTVNDMVRETLTYLREGGRSEPVHLVDLPSLLQTICSEFSDVGYERHGGEIALLDRVPQGLTVRLSLKTIKVEPGSLTSTMAGVS